MYRQDIRLIDPPRVMGEPKASYTTYKERNPVGQYRRTFTLPAGWKANGQTFLRFEGVMSAFLCVDKR